MLMKARLWIFLAVCFVGSLLCAARAGQASLYLTCTSLAVRPASSSATGTAYDLAFSLFDRGVINDELSVADQENDPESHVALAYLHAAGSTNTTVVQMFLSVPGFASDLNFNGLSDFFEVARGVTNATSTGESYVTIGVNVLSGTADALWNRAPVSATGSVSLHFQLPGFSVDITTVHAFEIFQYQGTFDYVLNATGAQARVSLGRVGGTDIIMGSMGLTRLSTVEIGFKAGVWTLDSTLTMSFFSSAGLDAPFLKGALPGGYFGLIGFRDGLPARPHPGQYQVWNVDLFDPNDWNKNRIPDLTDPVEARLSLAVHGAFLDLTVVAQAGISLNLERATSVSSASWEVLQTLTLTSATNTLTFPLRADSSGFYRVR